MENYNKDNELPYVMYWDASNLQGWAMSQKLPADGCKWKKILLNLMELHSMKNLYKKL